MFLTSHFCLQTINPSYKGFCFQRSLSFEHAAHTHVRFTSLYFLSSQHSVWYSVNIPPWLFVFLPLLSREGFLLYRLSYSCASQLLLIGPREITVFQFIRKCLKVSFGSGLVET